MLPFGLLLGVCWGCLLAVLTQFTGIGKWLSIWFTWLVVSIGVGGDLLIMLLLLDEQGRASWWQMVLLMGVSSVPVAVQGIIDVHRYWMRLSHDIANTASQ